MNGCCNSLAGSVKGFFHPSHPGEDSKAMKLAGMLCFAALITSLVVGILGLTGLANISLDWSINFTASSILLALPLLFFVPRGCK